MASRQITQVSVAAAEEEGSGVWSSFVKVALICLARCGGGGSGVRELSGCCGDWDYWGP